MRLRCSDLFHFRIVLLCPTFSFNFSSSSLLVQTPILFNRVVFTCSFVCPIIFIMSCSTSFILLLLCVPEQNNKKTSKNCIVFRSFVVELMIQLDIKMTQIFHWPSPSKVVFLLPLPLLLLSSHYVGKLV